MNSKTIEPLSTFTWDAPEDWTPDDFFNQESKEELDNTKPPPEEEEEDEEEGPDEVPADEPEEIDEVEKKAPEMDAITALANDLKQMGYLAEVGEKVNATDLLDLVETSLEEKIEAGIEQVIENWKSQIGETGAKFIHYTMSGGDPNEFFSKFYQQSVDISNEIGQEKFLRNYLIETQGYEKEDVDDLIERYKENDTLEKYAKRFHERVQSERNKEQQALLDQKEAGRREREENMNRFKENLREVARKTDHILVRGKNGSELGRINFTEAEKRSLVNYITNNTVEQNGRYISGFTDKFQKIWREEPDKLLLIAKLFQNDFDLSDFTQNAVSKKIEEVKTNLQRVEKKGKTKTKTGTNRPIWEIL